VRSFSSLTRPGAAVARVQVAALFKLIERLSSHSRQKRPRVLRRLRTGDTAHLLGVVRATRDAPLRSVINYQLETITSRITVIATAGPPAVIGCIGWSH
jgi:hypothetical protein